MCRDGTDGTVLHIIQYYTMNRYGRGIGMYRYVHVYSSFCVVWCGILYHILCTLHTIVQYKLPNLIISDVMKFEQNYCIYYIYAICTGVYQNCVFRYFSWAEQQTDTNITSSMMYIYNVNDTHTHYITSVLITEHDKH